MKKIVNNRRTQLNINEATVGDPIEIQMERILNNGELENIEHKELQYTRAEEGVIAITDIRSDKFDMAIEQNDKILADQRGKLEEKRLERERKLKEMNPDAVGGESVDSTSNSAD